MTDANTMVERLEDNLVKIADAARRIDGTDIPLGEKCRQAAALIRSQQEEIAALREIISKCASAAGGFASPQCSIEFMSDVPKEISLALRVWAAGRREG